MFIYAFAKGTNKGYLTDNFYKIAEESFNSLQDNFINNKNGLHKFNKCMCWCWTWR